MMNCHYCDGPTKIVAHYQEKPILVECLDYGKEDNYCKRTTIPITTNCLSCEKEFEWRFDPGWNEYPSCVPCKQKAMKDYFEDPEFQKGLKEAMNAPNSFLDSIPKDSGWKGGYLPVPFKLGENK